MDCLSLSLTPSNDQRRLFFWFTGLGQIPETFYNAGLNAYPEHTSAST